LFVAKRAECAALASLLERPVVKGFSRASQPVGEVKEAFPLPLCFLGFLEGLLLCGHEALGTRLVAGCILMAVWGSLRYSDFARTAPASLSIVGWVLRGRCWKAKNRPRGFPFALIGKGLCAACPNRGWVHAWMDSLDEWLSSYAAPEVVSFLLPRTSLDGSQVLVGKESRDGFRDRLRFLLQRWGKAGDVSRWTAHSCKSTVLSWATAKDCAEHWIAQQGHHKRLANRSQSVTTYGRSDTGFALLLQEQLLRSIAAGWRPMPAPGRGSLPPLPEPELAVRVRGIASKEFEFGFRKRTSWQPPLPESWNFVSRAGAPGKIWGSSGRRRAGKSATKKVSPIVLMCSSAFLCLSTSVVLFFRAGSRKTRNESFEEEHGAHSGAAR
jgi:hypothetical protein